MKIGDVMSDTLERVNIFIGYTGDVEPEAMICDNVIKDINNNRAKYEGIYLDCKTWKDIRATKGRPQDVINEELIENSDLVILILWERWGSETGKYTSGFEEEYTIADKNNIEISLYFRKITRSKDPGPQLKKVLEFREKIQKEKRYLYVEYKDKTDFKNKIMGDINKYINQRRAKKEMKKVSNKDVMITSATSFTVDAEVIHANDKNIRSDTLMRIGNQEVPYIRTESKSNDCILFGNIIGFNKIYYFCSHEFMTLEKLRNILKVYYDTFRNDFDFDEPSFLINQTCYEKNITYSWFGYGFKNFIQAIKDQSKRYIDARIIRPHHTEIAGFFSAGNDHIFYIGALPNTMKEYNTIGTEVEIGFVFEDLPFDNKKYSEFYKKVKLDIPNFIHNGRSDLKIYRKKSVIELKKEGLVTYKLNGESWVSGIICKNPYNDVCTYEELIEHNNIVVRLMGGHHPLNMNTKYRLIDAKIIQIPYGNFKFNVLNIGCKWINDNEKTIEVYLHESKH